VQFCENPHCCTFSRIMSLWYFIGFLAHSVTYSFTFYRATLCVSAVFAVARCLSICPSVRPSVCPPRWCVASRRLKISSNFFLGQIAHDSSFWPRASIPNSQRNPFSGGEIYVVEILATKIAVYLGNGARYADGYHGTLIVMGAGSNGINVPWYHFRWP